MTKRHEGVVFIDQDAVDLRSMYVDSSSPSAGGDDDDWSPMLGPKTPMHSPSSEEEFVGRRSRRSSATGAGLGASRRKRRSSILVKDKENQRCSAEPLPVLDFKIKRVKLGDDSRAPLGDCRLLQEAPSTCSTAASSSSKTPFSSPASVASVPEEVRVAPKDEYRDLTVDELRDRLGVTGTEIVSSWDRDDLIAALEALEQAIAEIPALVL